MGRKSKNNKPMNKIVFKQGDFRYELEFTKKGFTPESVEILNQIMLIKEINYQMVSSNKALSKGRVNDGDMLHDSTKSPYHFSYWSCTIIHLDGNPSLSPEESYVIDEPMLEYEWDIP